MALGLRLLPVEKHGMRLKNMFEKIEFALQCLELFCPLVLVTEKIVKIPRLEKFNAMTFLSDQTVRNNGITDHEI